MLNSTYNTKAGNADASALDKLDRVLRELFRATPLHVFANAARAALKKHAG